MAFLDYFRKPNRAENPEIPLTPALIMESYGRDQAGSLNTSPDSGALRLSAVFAAERFLVESIALLPLQVYRRVAGSKERATDHRLYTLLHDRPNEHQTPYMFWGAALRTAIRKGNAFIFIEPTIGGDVGNLLLLDNSRVKFTVQGGAPVYIYNSVAGEHTIPAGQMIHLRGFSDDGLNGKPLLEYASSAVALGLMAEQYGLGFFGESTTSPEHIELESWPNAEQMKILKDSQDRWRQDRHGTRIVPGGKLVKDGYSNQESQFLELRKFQLLECARLFRVPPQVIQHYENGGTYANLEAQSIDLVQNSLLPWITQLEQELRLKLFSGDADHFVAFLIDARLRGDTKSRYDAYGIGLDKGFLTVAEVRAMENMPALPESDTRPASDPVE